MHCLLVPGKEDDQAARNSSAPLDGWKQAHHQCPEPQSGTYSPGSTAQWTDDAWVVDPTRPPALGIDHLAAPARRAWQRALPILSDLGDLPAFESFAAEDAST
jgi:hypothetical protein